MPIWKDSTGLQCDLYEAAKMQRNHAMLNYEKIIQMNSKRQTKFQFKKKETENFNEKWKKQYNGEILVIHALLVAYIPLYFLNHRKQGIFYV